MFASNSSQVSSDAVFIEDVFSTYLYTGNSTSGGTQTITNNIDLSTKGGMVWIKGRSAASDHILSDTARGAGASATNNNALASNLTSAEDLGGSSYDFLSAFNADGFTVKQGGTTTATRGANYNNVTYTSWTFRKQAKFFDVVTYTGDGANRTISHNLGSVPGCIIVKRTDTTAAWAVYHRSLANTEYLVLNTTAAKATGATYWNSTTPTSTVFSLGTSTDVNANGGTYVAYLFAHDAGGFGASGSDNVISCGSAAATGLTTVNLGWEPQWVLIKSATVANSWYVFDSMRGLTAGLGPQTLNPNATGAEYTESSDTCNLTSTGFTFNSARFNGNATYIYIAIRRGPMRTPTSGTSVFTPVARTGTGAANTLTSAGFPVDLILPNRRSINGVQNWFDRLRGQQNYFSTSETTAESVVANGYGVVGFDAMQGVKVGTGTNGYVNQNGTTYVDYNFRRAPGFFDEVCYTGTGSARTVTHNLGAVPEMMIVKSRNNALDWYVYHADIGNTKYIRLNIVNGAQTSVEPWNNTTPTASVFTTGIGYTNESGYTYVAYLFASCPGVSKVGSYSGTGGTQTISCGFAARFVMIKRTDSTGDWWVWDTARGMVAGTDPRLGLNLTTAETNANWVYTDASGFQIVTTDATVNASGGTYIYLCVA